MKSIYEGLSDKEIIEKLIEEIEELKYEILKLNRWKEYQQELEYGDDL